MTIMTSHRLLFTYKRVTIVLYLNIISHYHLSFPHLWDYTWYVVFSSFFLFFIFISKAFVSFEDCNLVLWISCLFFLELIMYLKDKDVLSLFHLLPGHLFRMFQL